MEWLILHLGRVSSKFHLINPDHLLPSIHLQITSLPDPLLVSFHFLVIYITISTQSFVIFQAGIKQDGRIQALSVDFYQDQGFITDHVNTYFLTHALEVMQGGRWLHCCLWSAVWCSAVWCFVVWCGVVLCCVA